MWETWYKYHFVICTLLLCIREASWYRTKLQTVKSAVCRGSRILSADFLRRQPRPQYVAIVVDRLTSALVTVKH